MAARLSCLRLFLHLTTLAASRTFCTAGTSRPISTAMMAMTTSKSMRVKAGRPICGFCMGLLFRGRNGEKNDQLRGLNTHDPGGINQVGASSTVAGLSFPMKIVDFTEIQPFLHRKDTSRSHN